MNKNLIRCVHIFPKFKNSQAIDNIRKQYDYLHEYIEPHITIVFPFKSSLASEDILEELRVLLSDIDPFYVCAKGIEGVDNHGYYLFLNIDEGKSNIKELHYRIHKEILSSYQPEWTKDGLYKPHITIGRFNEKVEMERAAEKYKDFSGKYKAFVDRVYVEIIGENEESIIEGEVEFARSYQL